MCHYFRVPKKFGLERGWGVSRFSVDNFLSPVPKIFVGEPFCALFQKISGSEKVNGSERGGVSRFSVENYLSDSAEKFHGWGNPLALHSFRASIKFG